MTKMARLRGRAPKGERCRAAVPHGHCKTTTFTAGLVAPMLIDGAMDGPAFRVYVAKVFVPELRPGDVVVMDNLPAHKVVTHERRSRRRRRDCSTCRPTRQTSTQDGVLEAQGPAARRRAANHRGALATAQAIDRFEPAECQAYFAAAGYNAA